MAMLPPTRFLLLAILMVTFTFAVSLSAQETTPAPQTENTLQPTQAASPASQGAPLDPSTPSASQANPNDSQPEGIQADTKKLYLLALALRTEVGKTYKQSLSVDVLRKAQELEKLARSLKAEMDHEASAKNH